MKLKVSSKHAIALFIAVVALTILILGLGAPGLGARGNVRCEAVRQVRASACRIDDSGSNAGMQPHPDDNPLVHRVITSAISIADRL